MKRIILFILSTIFYVFVVYFIIDSVQTSALFSAIEKNDLSAVEKAIGFGADVNKPKYILYIPDVVGQNPTPLIQACKIGNQEMVELLLSNGADINKADKITGKTPFLSALNGPRETCYSLAFFLIEKGADIHVALPTCSPVIESAFVSKEDSEQIKSEGFSLLCYLLENGADATSTYFGESLLTYAAHYGNDKAVEYLLQQGYFDVDDRDKHECTALIKAAKHNQEAIVQVLLQYGANATLIDSAGLTAYEYAVQNNNSAIIDMLSEYTHSGS